jgi:hypothetical protein
MFGGQLKLTIAVAFVVLAFAPRVGAQNFPINEIENQNQKFDRADKKKGAKEAKAAGFAAQQAPVDHSKNIGYVPPTFANYQEAFKVAEQQKRAGEPDIRAEIPKDIKDRKAAAQKAEPKVKLGN